GAGEGHGVLTGEMIEEITDTAANELDGALGKEARLDDATECQLGQVGRGGRGLDDRGYSREKSRRQLFQHAPDGEVEGVDVHGRPFERHADVLAGEAAGFRQALRGAIDIDVRIGQLAHALARIHEEGGDAAVDVDPRIRLRGPGRIRERIELFFLFRQVLRERLEEPGALVKSQAAKVRTTDRARVREAGPDIESLGRGVGNHLARGRIAKGEGVSGPRLPATGDEAL